MEKYLMPVNRNAQAPKKNSPEWKYFRPSNTGVAGDYFYTMNIDSFGVKWTTGFYAFWEEGSINRFDDSVWTNWSNFEGYIPNDRVYVIEFDHLNRVWAGTDSGLAMFDGKKWTQYTIYNTPIKQDFHVRGIAFDKDNNLWFVYNAYHLGGKGGVVKFDGTNWTTYSYENGMLPTYDVHDIVIDKKNKVWVATSEGLVDLRETSYKLYTTKNSQLSSNQISTLYIDEKARLWMLGYGTLDAFDGHSWLHYTSQNSPLDVYVDCFDVRGDKILVGSTSSTAYIFNGTSWAVYPAPYHVYGTKIDSLGNYWMCGIGFLIKYDGLKTITYTRYNTGLPEYWMNDIFIDSKNRKWVSNGNGGVDLLDEPVWKDYGPWNGGLFPNPIPYTTIGKAATEDKFRNIWMAYEGVYGGVVEIPRGDETDTTDWVIWESANAHVDLQFINCMSSDSSGNIWVGLDHDSRVSVYTHATNKWRSFILTDYGLNGASFTRVQSIGTAPDGKVWIVSELGLVIFNADGSYNTTYSIWDAGGLPNAELFDIGFDSKGNKWIGSDSGLVKFDGINWTTYNKHNSGILANHTHSVAVGENDTIYAATFNVYNYPYYGGLSVFDGDNYWETFEQQSSPIPHKQVQDVEIDKLGNVWLDCESMGIAVYRKGGVRNEPVPCGAPENNFTSNITSNSAALNWETTAGGAQYQVKYKTANSTGYKTVYTPSPKLILTGLQPGTKYQWQVRSKCWKEQFSSWSAINTFTTSAVFAANEIRQSDQVKKTDVSVYPNPAKDYLLINMPQYSGRVKLNVYDNSGHLMVSAPVENTTRYKMNISNFKTGIYVLRVVDENGSDVSVTWVKE